MHTPFEQTPVAVAKALEHEYVAEAPMQTFGDWVLLRVFPDADMRTLERCRDFVGAQRTTDARMYLIGMFMSGCLSLSQAIEFLHACETAQD